MVYQIGPYELRADDLILLEDGLPAAFGPKVVATLLVLLENQGKTVSKDELLARIWPDGFADEGSLFRTSTCCEKLSEPA